MLSLRSIFITLVSCTSWGFLSGNRLASQTSVQLTAQDSLNDKSYTNRLLLEGAITSAPLVGIGLLQNLQNGHVRELRFGYYPHFRHHFDDYLQFAPLVAQVGLRLGGLQGTSPHMWQTFAADAFASISMLAITSAIKYTARIERPDGSTRNSFPSGHTAMAFTAATLLSEEYGQRYPLLSAAGYAVASAVGVGRLLNNRHWIGDVVTGAGLGILSGHLGYWMADRLLGGSRRRPHRPLNFPASQLQLYLPITISATRAVGEDGWSIQGRQVGLGLHYTPKAWPVYLMGQVKMGIYHALRKVAGVIPGTPEYRTIALSLGVGRTQCLWRQFILQGSIYGTLSRKVDHEKEDQPSPSVYLRGSRSALGLDATLAPSWRLTSRVGLRLPLSVSYTPTYHYLEGVAMEPLRLPNLHYSVGTALTVYL